MRILLVSQDNSPLAVDLRASILQVTSARGLTAQIEASAGLPEPTALVESDLIVVGLEFPDQFEAGQIEQALAISPLTRWMCVYGPWSESDGRNRTIWPFAVRVPWQRFPHRLEQEIAIQQDELPPLPLTASRNECFQFEQQRLAGFNFDTKAEAETLPILFLTDNIALREYYPQLLSKAGYRVRSHMFSVSRPEEGASIDIETNQVIGLIDLDPWSPRRSRLLKQWREQLPESTHWIGLTNEINPERIRFFEQQDIPTIVPKLMGESELLHTIKSLAEARH